MGGRKLSEAVVAEGSDDLNGPERNTVPTPLSGLFFTSWKKIERKIVLTKEEEEIKSNIRFSLAVC